MIPALSSNIARNRAPGADKLITKASCLLIGDAKYFVHLLGGNHLVSFHRHGILVVVMDLGNNPLDNDLMIRQQTLEDLHRLGVTLGEQRQQDEVRCQQILMQRPPFRPPPISRVC